MLFQFHHSSEALFSKLFSTVSCQWSIFSTLQGSAKDSSSEETWRRLFSSGQKQFSLLLLCEISKLPFSYVKKATLMPRPRAHILQMKVLTFLVPCWWVTQYLGLERSIVHLALPRRQSFDFTLKQTKQRFSGILKIPSK